MIENTVVTATILTESSVSLLYFTANIVVVAAVGAADAITQATARVVSYLAQIKTQLAVITRYQNKYLNPLQQ